MRLIYCLQSVNKIGSEKLHFLTLVFFMQAEMASGFLFYLALHYLILFILFITCV